MEKIDPRGRYRENGNRAKEGNEQTECEKEMQGRQLKGGKVMQEGTLHRPRLDPALN